MTRRTDLEHRVGAVGRRRQDDERFGSADERRTDRQRPVRREVGDDREDHRRVAEPGQQRHLVVVDELLGDLDPLGEVELVVSLDQVRDAMRLTSEKARVIAREQVVWH